MIEWKTVCWQKAAVAQGLDLQITISCRRFHVEFFLPFLPLQRRTDFAVDEGLGPEHVNHELAKLGKKNMRLKEERDRLRGELEKVRILPFSSALSFRECTYLP